VVHQRPAGAHRHLEAIFWCQPPSADKHTFPPYSGSHDTNQVASGIIFPSLLLYCCRHSRFLSSFLILRPSVFLLNLKFIPQQLIIGLGSHLSHPLLMFFYLSPYLYLLLSPLCPPPLFLSLSMVLTLAKSVCRLMTGFSLCLQPHGSFQGIFLKDCHSFIHLSVCVCVCCRRLNTLNKCALMRLEITPQRKRVSVLSKIPKSLFW